MFVNKSHWYVSVISRAGLLLFADKRCNQKGPLLPSVCFLTKASHSPLVFVEVQPWIPAVWSGRGAPHSEQWGSGCAGGACPDSPVVLPTPGESGRSEVMSRARGYSGSPGQAPALLCCGPGWSHSLACASEGLGGSTGQGRAQAALRALVASGRCPSLRKGRCSLLSVCVCVCVVVVCLVNRPVSCWNVRIIHPGEAVVAREAFWNVSSFIIIESLQSLLCQSWKLMQRLLICVVSTKKDAVLLCWCCLHHRGYMRWRRRQVSDKTTTLLPSQQQPARIGSLASWSHCLEHSFCCFCTGWF